MKIGSHNIVLHCPNKKTKVLRDNEIVTSEFSSINLSNIFSENDSECGTKCLDDELMMCRRLLGIQCKDRVRFKRKTYFKRDA